MTALEDQVRRKRVTHDVLTRRVAEARVLLLADLTAKVEALPHLDLCECNKPAPHPADETLFVSRRVVLDILKEGTK